VPLTKQPLFRSLHEEYLSPQARGRIRRDRSSACRAQSAFDDKGKPGVSRGRKAPGLDERHLSSQPGRRRTDALRTELGAMGVEVRDTPDGQVANARRPIKTI
jgi:hypothetical protein